MNTYIESMGAIGRQLLSAGFVFLLSFFLTKTRCTRLSFFYSLQFQRTLTLDSSFSLKCLSLFNFRRKKNKYYLKSYLPTYFKKFHKIFVVMVVQLPFKLLSSLSGKWNIDECRQIVQYHLENIESFLILSHVARPILEQRVPKLLSQKMMVKVCTQST